VDGLRRPLGVGFSALAYARGTPETRGVRGGVGTRSVSNADPLESARRARV